MPPVVEQPDDRTSLEDLLSRSPEGCDLLISAFAAALKHYRKPTVCLPFPSDSFTTQYGEKDFAACLLCLDTLPRVPQLAGSGRIPPQASQLLGWLLTHPRPRRWQPRLKLVSQQDLEQDLQISLIAGLPGNLRPTWIFELEQPVSEDTAGWEGQKRVAYHGTSMENVHSILHNGLLNLSGTKLQRTGALFGDGIYLSTNMEVRDTVPSTTLDAEQVGSPSKDAAGKPLPDTYLVVRKMDDVRLAYLLVYSETPGRVRRFMRLDACSLLVGLYVGCMLLLAVYQRLPKLWRTYLRRQRAVVYEEVDL
ncbi:hypothetical protein WJX72_010696 [[Myrmecia] bisecta]|uniref:PARP n=1 Tax=[Myrmecia] bisecta TaxID=41462 RepID=A0AAW1QGM2_9CHLO